MGISSEEGGAFSLARSVESRASGSAGGTRAAAVLMRLGVDGESTFWGRLFSVAIQLATSFSLLRRTAVPPSFRLSGSRFSVWHIAVISAFVRLLFRGRTFSVIARPNVSSGSSASRNPFEVDVILRCPDVSIRSAIVVSRSRMAQGLGCHRCGKTLDIRDSGKVPGGAAADIVRSEDRQYSSNLSDVGKCMA